MHPLASIHVVCRSDGIWQVEREDEIVPLSVHEQREAAIDDACKIAKREHRGVALHCHPRSPARWMDVAAATGLHAGVGPSDVAASGAAHRNR